MGDQIYTSVNPFSVGKTHEIYISPASGVSTVKLAAIMRGYDGNNIPDETINSILKIAKDFE